MFNNQQVQISQSMWQAIKARYEELEPAEKLFDSNMMAAMKEISESKPDSKSKRVAIKAEYLKLLKDSSLTVNIARDFEKEIKTIEFLLNDASLAGMFSDMKRSATAPSRDNNHSPSPRMFSTSSGVGEQPVASNSNPPGPLPPLVKA